MPIADKWGYSFCGEVYNGAFDTQEEAIEEAQSARGGERNCWVGRYHAPDPPESFLHFGIVCQPIEVVFDSAGDVMKIGLHWKPEGKA